jgi:hypothetical protein
MRVASQLIGSTVLLIAIGGVSRADAQITAATMSGIVRDDTGVVLPGVDVTVKNLETGLTRLAVATAADTTLGVDMMWNGLGSMRYGG